MQNYRIKIVVNTKKKHQVQSRRLYSLFLTSLCRKLKQNYFKKLFTHTTHALRTTAKRRFKGVRTFRRIYDIS